MVQRELRLVGLASLLVACTVGGPSGSVDGAVDADGSTADSGPLCALQCDGACCTDGQECVAGRCLDLCEGSRCGADDSECCGENELCVAGQCAPPGRTCGREIDCDESETCELLVGRCVPVAEDAECRFRPPSGVFEPWGAGIARVGRTGSPGD